MSANPCFPVAFILFVNITHHTLWGHKAWNRLPITHCASIEVHTAVLCNEEVSDRAHSTAGRQAQAHCSSQVLGLVPSPAMGLLADSMAKHKSLQTAPAAPTQANAPNTAASYWTPMLSVLPSSSPLMPLDSSASSPALSHWSSSSLQLSP